MGSWGTKLARGHKEHMGHHCFLSWCTGARRSWGSPRPSLLPFRENFPGFRFFGDSCYVKSPDKCCQLKSEWKETSWVWTAWNTHSLIFLGTDCVNLCCTCRKQSALSLTIGASPHPVPVMAQEDMEKKIILSSSGPFRKLFHHPGFQWWRDVPWQSRDNVDGKTTQQLNSTAGNALISVFLFKSPSKAHEYPWLRTQCFLVNACCTHNERYSRWVVDIPVTEGLNYTASSTCLSGQNKQQN